MFQMTSSKFFMLDVVLGVSVRAREEFTCVFVPEDQRPSSA